MENHTSSIVETTTGFNDEDASVDFVGIFIKSLYGAIGITGIVGNGLILAMLIKIPSLRNTTNLLIGHQSVTDFISSCLLLATFLPPPVEVTPQFVSRSRALAQIVCKFWVSRLFFWVTIKASTANLICITLERYLAVVHPLKYRERLKPREASVICGIIWLMGFMIQAYQLPTWFLEDDECVLRFRHRVLTVISGVWVFAMTLLLPLIVMSFVYASIIRALRVKITPATARNGNPVGGTVSGPVVVEGGVQLHDDRIMRGSAQTNHASMGTDNGTGLSNRQKREKVRRNVLSTLIIVSVTYAICWTPNQMYFLYFNLGGEVNFNNGLYYFTVLASAANMCMNPIIYAFKYRKFQLGMKQLILGRRFADSNETSMNTRSVNIASINARSVYARS